MKTKLLLVLAITLFSCGCVPPQNATYNYQMRQPYIEPLPQPQQYYIAPPINPMQYRPIQYTPFTPPAQVNIYR